MNKHRVLVIGAGVAGITAAIYLKRAGIDTVLIEKYIPGGQIIDNGNIENYPGFDVISGSDLSLRMLNQLKILDIPLIYDEVIKIDISNDEKKIVCKKNEYLADYVIVATGRHSRKLEVLGEEKYKNKGISYCAVCDGSLYKDKDVLVVGAGDAASDAAIYLSNIASKVKVLYRNKFRSKEYLQDRLNSTSNIELVKGEVIEFLDSDGKILVKTTTGNISVDGVFIYVGQIPSTSFLNNLTVLDNEGYIEVDNNYETKIDGVYAIGDCLKKLDYQIVIAESEGAKCALNIVRRINNE